MKFEYPQLWNMNSQSLLWGERVCGERVWGERVWGERVWGERVW